MSEPYRCPDCGEKTTYREYSGGKEWFCTGCGADGSYPEDRAPRRAGLLQSEDGRKQLRQEMHAELGKTADKPSTGLPP